MSQISPSEAAPQTEAVPWFVWIAVLAVTSAVLGSQWDIAWHRSVGRDAFWSPPHVAIYLGGVCSGLYAGYLILSTTLARTPSARSAAVRVWGFSGPLGAFIAAWGGLTMLASAPFDDWWHNAYGLDVKILSPPHIVLALGLLGIELGALQLIAGLMNRRSGRPRAALAALFLYTGGLLVLMAQTLILEYCWRGAQHSGTFYRVVACLAPLCLTCVGRGSAYRFGATAAAGVYSALMLLLLWLFPLVPATPKLGPVYVQVTHLIPAGFPLLLIFPALAMDLAAQRLADRGAWVQALVLGLLFLAVFVAVQWPMASFLLTPHSRNWVFGTHYLGYNTHPDWAEARNRFTNLDRHGGGFVLQMALAATAAVLTTRCGLALGDGLRRVRR